MERKFYVFCPELFPHFAQSAPESLSVVSWCSSTRMALVERGVFVCYCVESDGMSRKEVPRKRGSKPQGGTCQGCTRTQKTAELFQAVVFVPPRFHFLARQLRTSTYVYSRGGLASIERRSLHTILIVYTARLCCCCRMFRPCFGAVC